MTRPAWRCARGSSWTSASSAAPTSPLRSMEMIGRKTAALLAASLQAGAILADDTPETAEAFRSFGHHIGLAFQMADDVRAASGPRPSPASRRPATSASVKTLPLVWALQHAGAGCLPPARDLRRGRRRPMPQPEVDEVLAILEAAVPHRGAGAGAPLSRRGAVRPGGPADAARAPSRAPLPAGVGDLDLSRVAASPRRPRLRSAAPPASAAKRSPWPRRGSAASTVVTSRNLTVAPGSGMRPRDGR